VEQLEGYLRQAEAELVAARASAAAALASAAAAPASAAAALASAAAAPAGPDEDAGAEDDSSFIAASRGKKKRRAAHAAPEALAPPPPAPPLAPAAAEAALAAAAAAAAVPQVLQLDGGFEVGFGALDQQRALAALCSRVEAAAERLLPEVPPAALDGWCAGLAATAGLSGCDTLAAAAATLGLGSERTLALDILMHSLLHFVAHVASDPPFLEAPALARLLSLCGGGGAKEAAAAAPPFGPEERAAALRLRRLTSRRWMDLVKSLKAPQSVALSGELERIAAAAAPAVLGAPAPSEAGVKRLAALARLAFQLAAFLGVADPGLVLHVSLVGEPLAEARHYAAREAAVGGASGTPRVALSRRPGIWHPASGRVVLKEEVLAVPAAAATGAGAGGVAASPAAAVADTAC